MMIILSGQGEVMLIYPVVPRDPAWIIVLKGVSSDRLPMANKA
jgi:hypothetical protein